MKILIISDGNSVHTKRWIKSLKCKNIDVVLYSIIPLKDNFYDLNNIKYYCFDLFTYKKKGLFAPFKKYNHHIKAAVNLKNVINIEKPDILHAHYATSYGLLGALTGFHPFVISVWGSDVYNFPRISGMNRRTFEFIMRKADVICSTSNVMVKEISKYTDKKIETVPFGVDTAKFIKQKREKPHDYFKVGIVKSLSEYYGINYLIKAFKIFLNKAGNDNIVLEIVGEGPDKIKLQNLSKELGIYDKVIFRGFIDNDLLPEVFNDFDLGVYPSIYESFGVSLVECMSCGCPVIASDADGFVEILDNQKYGIIVPKKDVVAAADAIYKLYNDENLRNDLAAKGRKRVESLYDWNNNVDDMISIYKGLL